MNHGNLPRTRRPLSDASGCSYNLGMTFDKVNPLSIPVFSVQARQCNRLSIPKQAKIQEKKNKMQKIEQSDV